MFVWLVVVVVLMYLEYVVAVGNVSRVEGVTSYVHTVLEINSILRTIPGASTNQWIENQFWS